MTIYVAELEGRPIIAFFAETQGEAFSFIDDNEAVRDDLMVLESDGRSVWDGEAEIHIREAFAEERGEWDASRARAILSGEQDAHDDDWLVFLISVSDPTDEG